MIIPITQLPLKIARILSCGVLLIWKRADFHYGNLGFSVPQLQDVSEKAIMNHFEDVEITPVITCDPETATDSLPPYLVARISIMDFLLDTKAMSSPSESLELKIIDFGNCEFRQASR